MSTLQQSVSAKEISVKDACVLEALKVIEQDGLEHLSLREVARRLGISHQAPYKHFPSRDHILAEVVARTFQEFADYLDGREITGDPHEDMRAMGERYIRFALQNPSRYRLMFNTPLPPADQHPEMMAKAKHAFNLLTSGLSRFPQAEVDAADRAGVERDALFIWSGMHGIVSIFQSDSISTLALQDGVRDTVANHIMERIGQAMRSGRPGEDI